MPAREITQSVPAYAPAREPKSAAPAWSDPHRIARFTAAIPVVAGLLVLSGWATNVAVLRALGPSHWAAMNPMTAACLALIGGSLGVLSYPGIPRATLIARALALPVVFVGAMHLLGLVLDDLPALDQALFAGAMRSTPDGRTNSMAANSALNLTLAGTGLLLLSHRWRAGRNMAQLFGVVVMFTALSVLIGHLFRSGWFESIGILNRMALSAAIAQVAIGAGLFALSSGEGLAAVILSDGTGGAIARRLLPAALLVPPALGFVIIIARRRGALDADLGETLLVLATMVVFVWIVARNAQRIHEADTQRRAAEAKLRESESRFRLLAENSSDMVCLMDGEARVEYISPSCERVVGFLSEELVRMEPFALVHQEDAEQVRRQFNRLMNGEPTTTSECRVLHKSGRQIWLEMKWRGIANEAGTVQQLLVSSRDITERKEHHRRLEEGNRRLEEANRRLEETQRELQAHKVELEQMNRQLQAQASTDVLTGLRNRRAFEDRLEEELSRARRHGDPLSLVLLDIDHFKPFNDTFGHPAGDEVLRQVGRLLSRMMRDTDVAARYGGEEFAILLAQTDRDGAEEVAERLRRGIEEATWRERPITASVGVATLSPGIDTVTALIEHADRALYRSKEKGRNRVTLATA